MIYGQRLGVEVALVPHSTQQFRESQSVILSLEI